MLKAAVTTIERGTSTVTNPHGVHRGQQWKRTEAKRQTSLLVVSVYRGYAGKQGFATCISETGKISEIRLDRFRPRNHLRLYAVDLNYDHDIADYQKLLQLAAAKLPKLSKGLA